MTNPVPMKFDCYIPPPAKDIVFRRLFPIPEWDCIRAEWWTDHWVVSLVEDCKTVTTIDYLNEIKTLELLVTEAEALGCNVSKYRHLLKWRPLHQENELGRKLRS